MFLFNFDLSVLQYFYQFIFIQYIYFVLLINKISDF